MDIVLDFDGTCVAHDFPNIGADIGAVLILKHLVYNEHRLILSTMRADRTEYRDTQDPTIQDRVGPFLTDAVNWFKERDIPLYGIQTNPTQHNWTTSPKAYGQMIIDDIALGIPTKYDKSISEYPFVDWKEVMKLLIKKGLI
jgi:hypothetical protein